MSKKSIIGAAVGFVVGGPAGALVGFSGAAAKEVYDLQKDAQKQQRRARREARQARIDALRDRKFSSNAGANPRQIIYGRTRSGGQVVLEESSGTDNEFMHMILVFAAHPCAEIGDIYVDDQLLFKWSGSAYVAQGDFAGKVSVWTRLGNQSAAMPEAVSNIPSWTNSDRLLGQTYIYLRFRYDEDIWDNLRMNISAVIRGKNDILDPRTGWTGWTDNQALCTLDYLRWDRGMNIPDSLIDFDSFADAANVADQFVAAGAGKTEKRYTVNGTQAFDSPPLEVLASLEAAGAMTCVRTGKNWSAVAGIYNAGELELNSDDLIGGIEFSPRPDKSGIANIAKGTYVDPAQNYEAVDFVHLAVDSYIQSDREELAQDIDFPWTDSGTRARRLSKIYLEQTRYGLVVGCTMKFRAIDLAPGVRVRMTIPELGWNQRVFRVERISIDIGAGVRLALREDAPEIWSWTEGDALEVDAPPALNVPDPRFTPAPTNLMVSEELYSGAELGSLRVRAILSWQAGGVSSRAYDVQFKLATAARWNNIASDLPVESTQIDDLEPGLFDFRVRARNGIGVFSEWVQISYEVLGKQLPPPRPASLYINKGVLRWSLPNAPLDLAGYKVRYQNGNRSIWIDAIRLHDGIVTETRFDVSELEGGERTFLVKAVDTSGNESEQPAVLREGLGDPLVQNVIVEDCQQPDWGGTITGGQVVDGVIDADERSVFWGAPDSVFWPENRFENFWQADYEMLSYEFDFIPDFQELPAQLTVRSEIRGNSAQLLVKQPSLDVFWGNPDAPFWPEGDQQLFWGESQFDFIDFSGSADVSRRAKWVFKLVIPAQTADQPTGIDALCIVLDVPDISETLDDVIIQPGGTRIPVQQSYRVIKNVGITLQDDNTGALSAKIVDRDPAGPLIRLFNADLQSVAGSVDLRIQGY